MDTLSLTASNQEINTINDILIVPKTRTSLFYNQYEYAYQFAFDNLYLIRGYKNYQTADAFLTSTKHYYIHQARLGQLSKSKKKLDAVNQLICFIKQYENNSKLLIYGEVGYLYVNDLTIIDQLIDLLDQIDNLTRIHKTVHRACIVNSPNQITLKTSKYKYRTYFNNLYIESDDARAKLVDTLQRFDDIRLSPSLNGWTFWAKQNSMWYGKYINRTFFIDHNDPGLAIWLALVNNKLVRKTFDIVSK